MKQTPILLVIVSLFSLTGLGCGRDTSFVTHDEVLVYPLPLDVTYLRTLEAIDAHPDWDLNWTDKEKGLISIYNARFSSYADADERYATLVVKRVSNQESSVQLDPKSVAVVDGDEILALIKKYLTQEIGNR